MDNDRGPSMILSSGDAMSDSTTGVQVEALKAHVQAILDEVKRAGPEACRAVRYDVEARLPDELKSLDVGSASCAGLHVLTAVAMQISIDQALDGDLAGAIDTALEAGSWQQAADACEAAANP
jgi:hypothetical protein